MDEKATGEGKRLQRTMLAIGGVALVLVLAGLNRKLPLSFLKAPALDYLRWCDVNTIFILAPACIALMWYLFQLNKGVSSVWLTQLMILGVFFLGLGFGIHEPFNAMHGKFAMSQQLRKSVYFLDDDLSHWVFFAGFMLTSIAITGAEIRTPHSRPLSYRQLIFPVIAGLCTAGVVYFNMVWEETTVDITVMLVTTAMVALMQLFYRRRELKQLPLTICLYLMYGLGSLATIFHWGVKSALK